MAAMLLIEQCRGLAERQALEMLRQSWTSANFHAFFHSHLQYRMRPSWHFNGLPPVQRRWLLDPNMLPSREQNIKQLTSWDV